MSQGTQIATTTHSPNGGPTSVHSTSKGDGTSRTGGGSWSELSSNITWMEMDLHIVAICGRTFSSTYVAIGLAESIIILPHTLILVFYFGLSYEC